MIVLLHGLGVGPRYLRRLARELGDEDEILLPRRRVASPIPELARNLAREVAEPSLVVANSMGCQTAVELAVQRPELVEGLVLVGPTVDPAARSVGRQAARLAVDAWYEPPSLLGIIATDYLAFGPVQFVRELRYTLRHRIEELLPHVRCRAAVVRGSRDPLCPAGWAREAARLLPQGTLTTIAGAAHAAHFSHAAEVADAVRRLRRETRATAR